MKFTKSNGRSLICIASQVLMLSFFLANNVEGEELYMPSIKTRSPQTYQVEDEDGKRYDVKDTAC